MMDWWINFTADHFGWTWLAVKIADGPVMWRPAFSTRYRAFVMAGWRRREIFASGKMVNGTWQSLAGPPIWGLIAVPRSL